MSQHDLFEEVKAEHRELADPAARRRVRNRLLSREDLPRASPWRFALPAMTMLGVLGLGGVLAHQYLRPEPLEFQVNGSSGSPGDSIEVSDAPNLVVFSDGSSIALEAGRAHITEVDERGATMVLDAGRARLDITHRDDTRWTVQAGPYRVHVIGTRFDVSWNERAASLDVQMLEGRVRVEGPNGSRVLSGRDSFTFQARGADSGAAHAELAEPREPPALEALEAAEPEASESTTETTTQSVPTARATWRVLSRDGDYGEACVRLGPSEFQRTLNSTDAGEVELLARTLRLGRDGRAIRAYERLARSFRDQPAGRNAVFFLGQLHARNGSHQAAAIWFRRYLERSDAGEFALVAHGRLLESLSAAGEDTQAESLRYLERYPQGPHASLAERLSRP